MFPVIKWSGSKRSQAREIVNFFPKKIKTYYEPFLGGGSVLGELVSRDMDVGRYVCSDINKDLIRLWLVIRDKPLILYKYYQEEWYKFYSDIDYYYVVRERYNKDRDPMDFYFLLMTNIKGLVRYNRKGKFNSPVNKKRLGRFPGGLYKDLLSWSEMIKYYKVEFICQEYNKVHTEKGDFVYLDPPYYHEDSLYYESMGRFNIEELFFWMREQGGGYILSYDGKRGENDYTVNIPEDLYDLHEYISSGISSFSRMKGERVEISDSLYVKRNCIIK